MMRRTLAAAAATGLATLALAAPASAAPKSNDVLPLVCPAPIGTVGIVSPDNEATWTPGFIVGTHQLLIPHELHITFTSSSQPDPFVIDETKAGPVPAGAVTCTLDISGTDPVTGETFSGTGTVVAVLRGKP